MVSTFPYINRPDGRDTQVLILMWCDCTAYSVFCFHVQCPFRCNHFFLYLILFSDATIFSNMVKKNWQTIRLWTFESVYCYHRMDRGHAQMMSTECNVQKNAYRAKERHSQVCSLEMQKNNRKYIQKKSCQLMCCIFFSSAIITL